MEKDKALLIFNNRLKGKIEDANNKMDKLFGDWEQLHDYIIPIRETEFHYNNETNKVSSGISTNITGIETHLSDNALTQLGSKFQIPSAWLRSNINGVNWQREMISNVLEYHKKNFINIKDNAFMFRIVDNEIRAILSPSYERYDSLALYTDISKNANQLGMELYDFNYNGYSVNMNFIYTDPFAIDFGDKREWVQYGINIQNSDFGVNAFTMSSYLSVVVCDNGLIMDKKIRKIHRGKSLGDDMQILSKDTIKSRQIANTKELSDYFNYFSKPEYIEKSILMFKEAGSLNVNIDQTIDKLQKTTTITKETCNDLKSLLLNRPAEANINNSGGNYNTIIQGLTYLANNAKLDSKIELQELAGNMVVNPKRFVVWDEQNN